MVRPGEVVAHQSSRNEGPVPGPSGFSRRCSRSPCDRDVRQLHGCGVRQQTGGHGVEASVFVDQPPSEMDGVFRRPSRSEVSSRRVQRPGRCTQPSRASCGDRVVSPPSGGESTSSYVGQSVDRPVRDLPQREITTLLRSFARSVNPVELRPPAWDVSLVLQSLTGAPYEPLRTCEERFLAQKTLFLLALASAKRIGELHALSYRVSHTRDWGEVSFAFVTGFVAKTQDPSSLAPRFEGFTVPALTNARMNRNGRLLCPVRAVKVYLDRTAPHRPRCERLFVSAGRSKKEISKTTVSFWLRKTISRAYELSGTALPVPAPRARETRGIAPSILFRKNFAVDQVLKAGTWRRHTTFTRHYLRDRAHKSLDTFHLGPVVAAQSVV